MFRMGVGEREAEQTVGRKAGGKWGSIAEANGGLPRVGEKQLRSGENSGGRGERIGTPLGRGGKGVAVAGRSGFEAIYQPQKDRITFLQRECVRTVVCVTEYGRADMGK